MKQTYLYMITMLPPIPVEFVIASSWEIKDHDAYFKTCNTDGRIIDNKWKRVNHNFWVTIECLGKCDAEGELIDNG